MVASSSPAVRVLTVCAVVIVAAIASRQGYLRVGMGRSIVEGAEDDDGEPIAWMLNLLPG